MEYALISRAQRSFKSIRRQMREPRRSTGNAAVTVLISILLVYASAPAQTPLAPTLVSPANGSQNLASQVTLAWDTLVNASGYDLQVSTTSDFQSPVISETNLSSTTKVVGPLAAGSTYYWRVRARYTLLVSSWSDIWSFSTAALAPPPAPNLVSPLDNAFNEPRTLNVVWENVAGADAYEVEVSRTSPFTQIVVNEENLTQTFLQVGPLRSATKFYWRVRAQNAAGKGPWSSAWTFTTLPDPPETPAPMSPSDGSTDISTPVELVWTTSVGAVMYRVQIASDAAMQTIVHDEAGIQDSSATIEDLSRGATYYWRVNADNAGGTSPWSIVASFSTLPALPDPVILRSPVDGAEGQSRSPVLLWNTAARASSYRLHIAVDSSFSTLVLNEGGILDTSRSAGVLAEGTQYLWRVAAGNSAGYGPWSSTFRFRTAVAQLPSGPELISPSNASVDQPTTINFSWNDVPEASSYRIQVSLASDFASPIVDDSSLTSTSRSLTGLSPTTTYYWRVQWRSSTVTSLWSVVWQFSTRPPAPDAPLLVQPPNGESSVPLTTSVGWIHTDRTDGYRMQMSQSGEFSTSLIDRSGIIDTTFSVEGLSRNTTYFWRVKAVNMGGESPWSATWSFTTIPFPPSAPSVASPADAASDQPSEVTCTWNAIANASRYRFQLSTSSTFTDLVVDDSTVTDSSRRVYALDPGTTYHWRVNASNEGGQSPWSEPRSFTTKTADPQDGPVLVSPTDGSIHQPVNVTLTWNSVSGATSYHVQVSRLSDFTTTVVNNQSVSGTSLAVGPLSFGTRFYWRVRSMFLGIPAEWSFIWSFTTIPAPPGAPVLASPSNGASNQQVSPALLWNRDADAQVYGLQVSGSITFDTIVFQDSSIVDTVCRVGPLGLDSTYYWRVNGKNVGGRGPFSTVWSFRTTTKSQPTVFTDPPSDVGPTSAVLHARVHPQGDSTTIAFEYGTDLNYGTVLAANVPVVTGMQQVNVQGLLEGLSPNRTYHVRIRGTNSGGTVYGTDVAFTTPIPPYAEMISAAATVPFPSYRSPSDYTPSGYRIVGLPGSSNLTINNFLSGSQNVDWQVYWDNGDNEGSFRAFNGSPEFQCRPGRAFWLIRKGPWVVAADIPSAPLNTQGEVEIPLHPGWNLITNPFLYEVPWSTVQSLNSITDPIYTFGGSFNVTTMFVPYVGYYFFNANNLVALRVSYSSLFDQPQSAASESDTWRMQIIMTEGETVDSSLWIGVAGDQPNKRSSRRLHKPMPDLAMPGVYFRRPEWDSQHSTFASDVREDMGGCERWEFHVRTITRSTTRLQFEEVRSVPAHLSIMLIDEERSTVHDLRHRPEYEFLPVRTESRFSILVGLPDQVNNEIHNLPVPKDLALGQNYPNPFNPSTLIPLELPESDNIELSIVNILGQSVAVVHSGMMAAGKHWLTWNGRDALGRPAASGVYLVLLRTSNGETMSRRMILAK